MTVLDLLASDETTVLFSFDDPSGAVNPNAVKTTLMADLDVGTIEPSPSIFRTSQGASRIAEPVVDPVEMRFSFTASATTYANLATGLGVLARWLRDPPGPLRFVDGSVTRYYDLLGTTALPTLFRGQSAAGLVVDRFSSVGPIPIRLLRQPWTRGASVTTSAVTVPNDPATSTKVRVYPVTITGDLPTPAKIKVITDTTSRNITEVFIAHRARGGNASTFFSNYLSETGFAQLEASGRGWTVAFGSDTAGAVDANASPGSGTSVARCTYATLASQGSRVIASRTTNMDSLRGAWDVWLRCAASATALHRIWLLWRASSEVSYVQLDYVEHNATTTIYTDKKLGRIYIPEGAVPVAGLWLNVHAARISGSGNLDMDFLWLTPATQQGTVTAEAVMLANQSLLTDPTRSTVERLDTTGSYAATLDVTGEVPAVLEPGDNHLMLRGSTGALGTTYLESRLATTLTVSVTYSPRYAL